MSSQAVPADAPDAADDPFADLPAFDVIDGELVPRAATRLGPVAPPG